MVNSRSKGKRGELEAAKLFQRWFPGCGRSLGQARRGYEQPDLIGGEPRIEDHLYVEVKRVGCPIAGWRIAKWLSKMKKDWLRFHGVAPPNTLPLIVYRRDRGDWFVCVPWHRIAENGNDPWRIPWADFERILDRLMKEEVDDGSKRILRGVSPESQGRATGVSTAIQGKEEIDKQAENGASRVDPH